MTQATQVIADTILTPTSPAPLRAPTPGRLLHHSTAASPRSSAPRRLPPSSMAEVSHLEAAFERITVNDENGNAEEQVASYHKAKVRCCLP